MTELNDADIIRRWAEAGVHILREHRDELNALNVFPVPDGDTGTNMYLTFRAAAEAEAQRAGRPDDASDALSAMARGALLGARGNSGVILAQVLHAAAAYAQEVEGPLSFKALLVRAAQAARAAVADPQEGTALTVLDAAAASVAREPGAAASAARETLERTTDMLPALQQAGVVDAGGRAAVLLLDTLTAIWHGVEVASPPVGFVPLSVPHAMRCSADAAYEVMFIVESDNLAEVTSAIENHGVSLVVTAGPEQAQIHIHTDSPELVIARAHAVSSVRHVRMESLLAIHPRRVVVAHAFGPGVIRLLVDAGVVVVPGEPDARPSVQDFVSAALKSEAVEVILLSSDKDSIHVCELAAIELRHEGLQVEVVPTTSVTQTLAAIAVENALTDFGNDAHAMRSAGELSRTVAVCAASRDSSTPIGDVRQGDLLTFVDGQLIAHSTHFADAVIAATAKVSQAELVTVIFGVGINAEAQAGVLQVLAHTYATAEITTIDGHQDVWQILVGIE